MIIDAYSHVFPMPLIDALAEVSPTAELKALRSQSPYIHDADKRIAFMDEHGFDVQVLVLARPPVWLGMERGALHRMVRVANDSIAAFAKRHPSRFIGVGVIPVVDDVMMEEYDRALDELGLAGVLIFTNIEGTPARRRVDVAAVRARRASGAHRSGSTPSTPTSTRGSARTCSTAPWRGRSTPPWRWPAWCTAGCSRGIPTSPS